MKMNKPLLTLLVFFLLAFAFKVKATHIVGGELQLRYKSGNLYEFILNLYFDEANGNPGAKDNTLKVSIFSKGTNRFIDSLTLSITMEQMIEYSNPACTNPRVRTKLIRYSREKELNPQSYSEVGGYYMIWERCCRNNGINNILNPGQNGMTFYLEFPALQRSSTRFINSSPAFNLPKGDYLCAGKPFVYNFAATDPDGDQLVYSLITPLAGNSSGGLVTPPPTAGPYKPVTWLSGYNATRAIPGEITADNLKIHPQTGIITGIPDKNINEKLFVFSILCEEFRNGQKIGEVRRDFQLYVLNCPKNDSPSLSLQTGVDNGKALIYKEGETLTINTLQNNCFTVWVKDPDMNDRVNVTLRGINFQPRQSFFMNAQAMITSPQDSSRINFCWPVCLTSEPGKPPFEFELIVKDSGCPASREDTLRVKVYVPPIPNETPVVSTSLANNAIRFNPNEILQFDVFATDKDNDLLNLTINGFEIDLKELGIVFSPAQGRGNIKSTFTWQPDCEVYSKIKEQTLVIDFEGKDKSLCDEKTGKTRVEIQVSDVEVDFDNFLPNNAFSPNGDGINDYFFMPDLPGENCIFQFVGIEIFNRWGTKVYTSKQRDFHWDGGDVSSGVYFYTIDYKNKKYKGRVTLFR